MNVLRPKAYLTVAPNKKRYNLEGDLNKFLHMRPLNKDEVK